MRLRFLLLIVSGSVLGLAGCDGRGESSGTADRTDRTAEQPPPDPLAGAPADLPGLLTWAETRLKQETARAPLPRGVRLTRDIWPVTRLAEAQTFKRADKDSSWEPRQLEPTALAEIGPFRVADGPRRTFNVTREPAPTPDGDQAYKLIMGGFNVQRDEVGIIEMRLKVPFGHKCTLRWGKAGEIPILIRTTSEPFNVRIRTDGLAEWRGPLRAIQLVTDGASDDEAINGIEVESLRFLSHAHAFPFGVGQKRVRVGTAIRDAVYTHSPATVRYRNLVMPNPVRFVASLAAEGAADQPVTFRVSVVLDGATTAVLEEQVTPGEPWRDVRVDLDAFADRKVDLLLETECAAPETAAIWGTPEVYRPEENPPLVVLYLIDTLSSEHLDLYGFQRDTAPVIAALGRKGAWFQQMVSNSPRTVESIPDMMLSMTTERHGVYHNLTPAPTQLYTLAEVLEAAGFATSAYVTNVYAGPRANMDQGFGTFVDKIAFYWTDEREFADRTVPLAESMAWLDANADRPRFLYIHTAEPHAPYTPPEGYRGWFDSDYAGPFDGTYGDPRTGTPHFQRARKARDIQHIVALYNEEIRYADAQLGKFLGGLKARDLLEKVNIFITADHGEEFYQHGAWEHGLNVHNEQTRVPLVAAGPLIPQQGRLDTPAALVDVMPTILDLFGLARPYELEGRSLVPVLKAERSAVAGQARVNDPGDWDERVIVGSNHNYRSRMQHIDYFAIRGGQWKLVYGARPLRASSGTASRFALFDIAADPQERRNVIEENAQVARELVGQLLAWRAGRLEYDADRSAAEMDLEQLKQLEEMGYVGGNDEASPPAPTTRPANSDD